jgi:hypothetical protein
MQDVLRSQYRINILCRNIYKFARRHRVANPPSVRQPSGIERPVSTLLGSHSPHSCRLPRTPKSRSDHSNQGRAKAGFQAYLNVMGRLIKEEGLSPPRRR